MSVRFILDVRIKPGHGDELMAAYAAVRQRVGQEAGLVSHQLLESIDDPERWLIVSEWDSLEASASWDRSEEHNRLIGPVRACLAGAQSSKLYVRDGVQR